MKERKEFNCFVQLHERKRKKEKLYNDEDARVQMNHDCKWAFRYIKMSSPHLNNLIIVGCMLTYSSVIFLGLDSTLSSVQAFPYICTARAWLLMAGFSLAFGAMFSKTWRVHSIFTDVKLNKRVSIIKRKKLLQDK